MFDPKNRLNELSAKQWLKFTKTWFVHNPPPRKKVEQLHPAKYPENLIKEFIEFFTKPGQVVFDPFLGTGSTLVAAQQTGRKGIGIELQKRYAEIAKQRVDKTQHIIIGNAFDNHNLPEIDLVITSPPYGAMLQKKSLAAKKRSDKGLDTQYSDDEADLGNVETHDEFVEKLNQLFIQLKPKVKLNGHVVIILQNYMQKGTYIPLAWDVAKLVSQNFQFRGERIWCQDNKTLYPYGYRYSFVPNVHHHYCLIFKKIEEK
ncbi:site-specific DNA-methyltransferase [Candidatus Woesearchaeota archaeon]|nr:site-specific DNA-methyltransferase [Candidatus Woesearchaeota archaeon]